MAQKSHDGHGYEEIYSKVQNDSNAKSVATVLLNYKGPGVYSDITAAGSAATASVAAAAAAVALLLK